MGIGLSENRKERGRIFEATIKLRKKKSQTVESGIFIL
jgi:hypothetical protein